MPYGIVYATSGTVIWNLLLSASFALHTYSTVPLKRYFFAPSKVIMFLAIIVAFCLVLSQITDVDAVKYQPTWESLDSRPNPSWYDEAKFGIFMHWGVYSVPSFYSEWFWWCWKGTKTPACVDFMKNNYRPDFSYADFAPMFRAEFFNPDQWADLLARSGARFVLGLNLWGLLRSLWFFLLYSIFVE